MDADGVGTTGGGVVLIDRIRQVVPLNRVRRNRHALDLLDGVANRCEGDRPVLSPYHPNHKPPRLSSFVAQSAQRIDARSPKCRHDGRKSGDQKKQPGGDCDG